MGHLYQTPGALSSLKYCIDMDTFPQLGVRGGGHHEVYGAICLKHGGALSSFEYRCGPGSPIGGPERRASRSVWAICLKHWKHYPHVDIDMNPSRYGPISPIGTRRGEQMLKNFAQGIWGAEKREESGPVYPIEGPGRRASRSVRDHLSRLILIYNAHIGMDPLPRLGVRGGGQHKI